MSIVVRAQCEPPKVSIVFLHCAHEIGVNECNCKILDPMFLAMDATFT
jgi:hypothetical protein